ncbi:hypothetical protein C4O88_04200 [Pasteurellaceae bacterium 12591]|nr:hypothetical protein C4O88_04200 [Pasteurellaceae bacterium 12591]
MMKLDFIFSRISKEEYFLFCLLGVYVFVSHFILCLSLTFLSLLGSFIFWIFIYHLSLRLFILLFCFYTLLVGMMIPLYLYKGINLSIIASIFESNLSESIEYISTISYYQFISIFVYFSFGFFILYRLVLYSKLGNKNKEFKNILLLLLFLLLVTFYKPVKEYVKGSGFSVLNIRVYPIQLVSNIYYLTFSYFNQKEMLEYGINIEPDWKIQSVNSKYDNYVLVIGESMRADYMSLYGYPIETTPFLKRTRGIVFTNYISSAPNTQPSFHVGNEYQESFSVPLVKISSDDLKQIKIDARRSGMFFLNAFSEWLGIDEESLKLPYLFFSNDVDKKPTIVFDWENYIIFDSLPKDSAKK